MDNDFRFDPFQEEDDTSFNTTEIDLLDTITPADLGMDDPDYYESSATYDGQSGETYGDQPEGGSWQDENTNWQDGDAGWEGENADWQGDNTEWQGEDADWQYEDGWQYEDDGYTGAEDGYGEGPEGPAAPARPAADRSRRAAAARSGKDDLKGRSKAAIIILIAAVLVIAILAAASLIIVRRRQAESTEDRLLATVEEIRADVGDGRFDDAMAKVQTLVYTRSWPDGMQEKWDGIRGDMTEYVELAKAGVEAQAAAEYAAAEEAAAAEAAEEAAEKQILGISYYTDLCRESIPFDNVSVLTQDNIVYVTFWQNGYGDQALYALENGGEARQNWNSMINDILTLNSSIKSDMTEHGFAEYDLVFALLNDLDTRLTLVEFTNGAITYDALSE